VINVSSPNTPNLRQLQDKAALDESLRGPGSPGAAGDARASGSTPSVTQPKPVLVKVAPDLTFEALDEILELAGPRNVAGLVATNTHESPRPQSQDPVLQRSMRKQAG